MRALWRVFSRAFSRGRPPARPRPAWAAAAGARVCGQRCVSWTLRRRDMLPWALRPFQRIRTWAFCIFFFGHCWTPGGQSFERVGTAAHAHTQSSKPRVDAGKGLSPGRQGEGWARNGNRTARRKCGAQRRIPFTKGHAEQASAQRHRDRESTPETGRKQRRIAHYRVRECERERRRAGDRERDRERERERRRSRSR